MSDPVAEAAAQLAAAPGEPVTGNVLVNETPVVAAPVVEAGSASLGEESASATPSVSTIVENSSSDASQASTQATDGNVLVNAAPLVDAPNVESTSGVGETTGASVVVPSASSAEPEVAPLPRESHLMLLEAKIAGFRAKLANAERVALDEFEAIIAHVKAVL